MRLFRVFSGLALALALAAPSAALGKTKVACIGEQTTHSLHRENDPEYPELMGRMLDADFAITRSDAPSGGGFLEGGGTNYTVGNFGHPRATVLIHDLENPRTYLKSEEFQLVVAFEPNLVVLGPFGDHEELSKVSFDNFPADMKQLVDALLAISSKPTVAMALPLPEGGEDKSAAYTQIKNYSQAAADEYKLPVIDLWTEFMGKTELFSDDTHLTLEGRQHLAQFVGDAVEQIVLDLSEPEPMPGGGTGGGTAGVGGTGGAAQGGSATNPAPQGGSSGSAPEPAAPAPAGTAGMPSSIPAASSTSGDSSGCTFSHAARAQSWLLALAPALLLLLRRRSLRA